jgi:hypothetical protein
VHDCQKNTSREGAKSAKERQKEFFWFFFALFAPLREALY